MVPFRAGTVASALRVRTKARREILAGLVGAASLSLLVIVGGGALGLATGHMALGTPTAAPSAHAALAFGALTLAWGPPAMQYVVPSSPAGASASPLGHAPLAWGASGGASSGGPAAMPTGPSGFMGGMHCTSSMSRMAVVGTAS